MKAGRIFCSTRFFMCGVYLRDVGWDVIMHRILFEKKDLFDRIFICDNPS
jgi:hypothetical protein